MGYLQSVSEQGVIRRTRPRAPDRPHASDFTELAARVRQAGLMRRRYGYYWTKLVLLPLAFVAACIVFVWIGDTWWQLVTAVAFGVLLTQIAFLGHDAAHRQIFVSGKMSDWTCLIIGDLFIGMSYGWWRHKHTRHHANPNKEGVDPDLDLPVISFTVEQANRRRNPVSGWLVRHQGIFFYPILLLEGVSLHASSVVRVLSRQPVERRLVEICLLSVRLAGFVMLVFLVLSPGVAAGFLAVQLGVFGLYMGVSFAPNHKGMPVVPAAVKLDFLRRQVMMSRNIRGNRFVDTMMGGLNYQIEHHLFPSMPRPYLRRAAPLVRAYCREVDVPYTQVGLFRSYAIVLRHINRVGLGERDPFDCPIVAQRRSL
ncbi:fatty acid desaturase family protein [Agromyces sp. NPDC058484]|uniref:fatty acid desaturase family protein n=1 Tax=Agromyces sp. NPDC058484 TaxID=3346524 RepID=UPI0036520667